VKGVQSYLGFCNFYRRFIKNYSKLARALYRLTRQDVPFEWSQDCQEAFDRLKESLTDAPVLRHYQSDLPTRVETDASDEVVAGVLSQKDSLDQWHPIAYFSTSMTAPEQNYEIHDKEMLAIIRALGEWRAELEGLQREDRFEIITNHRALEYFMTTKKLNARQARWADFLSRFHFTIKYRPGKENTLADALTRKDGMNITQKGKNRTQVLLKPESLEEGVMPKADSDELSPIEADSDIIERVLRENQSSRTLEDYRVKARKGHQDWELDGERLLFQGRLVVPKEGDLIARLLDEIHRQKSTAHPGRAKTLRLIKERYYWDTWRNDIRRYGDNCLICKRMKAYKDKTPGLLRPLPIPARSWQHIAMDFRSVPKDKNEHDAIFAVVDRLTKRPISIPCHKTATAKDMAWMYIDHIYR
jgi:hypothetical protein